MFCPKCGHQQASETQRYCSRCGLSLDGVADLLANNDERMKLEKREVIGISLALSTLLVALIYLIVIGAITVPQIPNKQPFLVIWINFLVVALGLSTLSVIYLARSGFFKKLKERQAKIQLAKMTKKRNELEPVKDRITSDTNPSLRLPEPVSVTETTTRSLEVSYEAPKRESAATEFHDERKLD